MLKLKSVLVALSLLGTVASADIGVGVDQSLAGVKGLSLNYSTDGKMIGELIVGAESKTVITNNITGEKASKMYFALAARFFYPLVQKDNLFAHAGLGLNFTNMKGNIKEFDIQEGTEETNTALAPKAVTAIELPMRVEYFVHPSLSLHTAAGIKFGMDGANNYKGLAIRGNLIGNAGLTVWFKMPESKPKKKPAKKVAPQPEPEKVEAAEDEEEEEEEEE